MADVEVIWEASDRRPGSPGDEDGDWNECELVQVPNVEKPYQLSMTRGRWSGYPTIALDRKQLKDLAEAIDTTLERK